MTKVWNTEGQLSLRRYNSRGPPYQVYERYSPTTHMDLNRSTTRGIALPSSDAHQNEHEQEQDSKTTNRRRIPVACGRCRKRKIRCSGPGDPLKGELSCQNCKTAGNENCQFNRVASEEIPFVRDNALDYPYDPVAAGGVPCRSIPHTGSYGTTASNYGSNSHLIPMSMTLVYRTPTMNEYQYPAKSSAYVPSYGSDYADDSLDYGLPAGSYSQLNPEVFQNYNSHMSSSRAAWTPIPSNNTKSTTSGLAFDSESTYAHYSNQSYPIRSNIHNDGNNFSFTGMANSLPMQSSMASIDRLLPVPSNTRAVPTLPNHSRSLENLTFSNVTNEHGSSPVKSLSNTAVISSSQSNSVGYIQPLSRSPDSPEQSYSSSGLSTSLSHSQHDLYGSNHPGSWEPPNLASDSTIRSHASSSDLYTYSQNSESSRKVSQSGRSTTDTQVSNGHIYVPFSGPGEITRAASIDATSGTSQRSSTSISRTN